MTTTLTITVTITITCDYDHDLEYNHDCYIDYKFCCQCDVDCAKHDHDQFVIESTCMTVTMPITVHVSTTLSLLL